jgi:N-acyl-D-aspartate/D-glutamate deacylase
MLADLVVFDPDSIRTDATSLNPCVSQKGIDYVLVNGTLVADGGRVAGALPGRVLEPERGRLRRG